MVKFLATAAVTGLLLSASAGVAPVTAQTDALVTDSAFIQRASSLALLQVKLGKLAQKKASGTAVRDFGERMVTDYTKQNEELAAGAKQAAFPSPVLMHQDKQTLDRLSSMGGTSFEKAYMAEAVQDHNEAVHLYERESQDGRVASLKQLAASMLPAAQEHLSLATQTAEVVGADVTAANPGERRGS
jgi:putative membrane protein